ncbi:hypothetical protein GH714_001914 [Hevea brasiliensis]|uniref:Uncharacterized protein n=1 Tax=Hevea brasiliensis TaxID=3981 RepID=A0A6A6L5U8_HEVBR|nr:hypothetical protein GH714_001914 [Hevea brasiliensis]
MSGPCNSTIGNMNQSLLNFNTSPAGMQGARQDPFSIFGLSSFLSETASQTCPDNVFDNKMVPKLKTVSTELNIGSSQSDYLSSDSQSSVHSFATELVGNSRCNSTQVGISSFQLFGKIIHINQPVESGFDDAGYMEDCGSKGYNENSPLDLALSSSYTELLNRIDVQCQRASETNDKEENHQNDVKASEKEADGQCVSSLKNLINIYKAAILLGDERTVLDVEARIMIIENENTQLIQKVSALSAEITSGKEKNIRLQADFDNFRKRSEKERLTIRSNAQGEVIESLLPMVDSFERAQTNKTRNRKGKED